MFEDVNRLEKEKQETYNTLFEVLSHERRRYALYCLETYATPMTLADLADEVARLEHDAETLSEVPAESVKRVYLDLYHSHIPKMEDASLLEYTQEYDAVQLRYDLSALNLRELL
uniref:DUF7344 domain-containing protein n=1 Tax=Halorussus TaxID=1070314 RepID=UPI00209D5327|nr:hypothetical protein [Halorussus vallis]USZ75127.1 hypothetical protein NGM07_17040 [Halorussus vallis]